jgi:hypothetical protein
MQQSFVLAGLVLFTDGTAMSDLACKEMYKAAGAFRGRIEFSQVCKHSTLPHLAVSTLYT